MAKRSHDDMAAASSAAAEDGAAEDASPSKMAAQELMKCPYLDTIKRPVIDFDFEKVRARAHEHGESLSAPRAACEEVC